jgi:hypothetical protein
MLLCPDVIGVLLATVFLLPRRGVGMRIKCEYALPIFGCFCLIYRGSARARRTERWRPRSRRSSARCGRLSGRSLGLRGTSVVSPRGFRPYFSECVLRGNNSGIPDYHPRQSEIGDAIGKTTRDSLKVVLLKSVLGHVQF